MNETTKRSGCVTYIDSLFEDNMQQTVDRRRTIHQKPRRKGQPFTSTPETVFNWDENTLKWPSFTYWGDVFPWLDGCKNHSVGWVWEWGSGLPHDMEMMGQQRANMAFEILTFKPEAIWSFTVVGQRGRVVSKLGNYGPVVDQAIKKGLKAGLVLVL